MTPHVERAGNPRAAGAALLWRRDRDRGRRGAGRPHVIAAFEGWNDAADAASGVVDHLLRAWKARSSAPSTRRTSTTSRSTGRSWAATRWDTADHLASTQIAVASLDLDRDVVLIRGIEPNMRWRQFCASCSPRDELGGTLVVTLGALLADTPPPARSRSRAPPPSPTWSTASSSSSRRTKGPPASSGSSRTRASRHPRRVLLGGGAVLAAPPCPKATLALVGVGGAVGATSRSATWRSDPRAWERGVDELADEDEDIADYVRALEETRDTTELLEAQGDAIAREFERYLKRGDPE